MRILLHIMLLLLVVVPTQVLGAEGAAGQLIDQQELRQLLDDYLVAESARLPRIELRFSSVDLPEPFRVPQGQIDYQVIPARPEVIGSRRVTLLTRVDDQLVSNLSIRVELEALAEVLVATSNLRRGDTLNATNLVLQQLDISRLKQPIFVAEEVYGKQLKQALRLGQPLSLKQVDFPPLIKRGERVEIRLQRGGMILTAAGEARQDGFAGETIKVKNIESQREILAQVFAAGLVRVEF